MKDTDVKKAVKEGYGKIAKQNSCCCAPVSSCCGGAPAETISKSIGYSDEDMKAVPEGANLGLGCGNPVALASLKAGETVLDLGSGAGFDCFLAAERVGNKGKVIGVDMTPEMVEKAKGNARKGGYKNVDFRLGEIEKLPVEDNTVDAIISNCVINLSPDKPQVFREAYRVLKTGGRLMVSDLVLLKPLPPAIKESVEAYIGCLSGAMMKDDYLGAIKAAGFKNVKVVEEKIFPLDSMANDPTAQALIKNLNISDETLDGLLHSAVSVRIQGVK